MPRGPKGREGTRAFAGWKGFRPFRSRSRRAQPRAPAGAAWLEVRARAGRRSSRSSDVNLLVEFCPNDSQGRRDVPLAAVVPPQYIGEGRTARGGPARRCGVPFGCWLPGRCRRARLTTRCVFGLVRDPTVTPWLRIWT